RAMAEAAGRLVGERDFAALQGAGSGTRTTTRRMTAARVRECSRAEAFGGAVTEPAAAGDRRVVAFEITGNGFLRHMVRNAAGSLVEIGLGRRPPSWLDDVLASRNREEAGPTAPARGLFLVSVDY
ncbi:MAG: tRNA pseudouridine(38-40) synthase TruA, partial [Acidobacteria bacterium]